MSLRLTIRSATKLPYRAIQTVSDRFVLSYARKLILEIGLLDLIVPLKRINQKLIKYKSIINRFSSQKITFEYVFFEPSYTSRNYYYTNPRIIAMPWPPCSQAVVRSSNCIPPRA